MTTIPGNVQPVKIYHLYVKTHRVTGLRYLGYTCRADPFAYTGSGTRWRAHLRKHGPEHDTLILLTTESYDEIVRMGRYYSNLWDVVKSPDWANLRIEEGRGGAYEFTEADRRRISEGLKGKKKSVEAVANLVDARKRNGTYVQSPESLAKRSAVQKGRAISPEHRKKIADSLRGRKKTPEQVRKAWESRRRKAALRAAQESSSLAAVARAL